MFARRLWVRTSLFALLALVTALLAPFFTLLPFSLPFAIEPGALERLLAILTNSMLAVTTFSLSIMVSAHLAADGSATPRAHRLLREDGRTHAVIATFVGAFIYALTLTVMLSVGLIQGREVALIYLVSIAVILLVVIAILRWVAHLTGLGSVESTLDRVEDCARGTLRGHLERPFLGARSLADAPPVPADASAVLARGFGHVQNIGTAALSSVAEAEGAAIWLAVAPGDLVGKGDVLAWISIADLDDSIASSIAAAITLGQSRDYGQDPVFALMVMTEIAERALSPGINDPGTAIDAVARLTGLIDDIEVERVLDTPPRASGLRAGPRP
ncbi:DUF2254 domain-containing protein [Anianabacter salinae]|uniref:DUF2254 domain-containing protein n=1 Tax=Anianabacter salinae TaxID=2851023 RepID=UPI00225E4418|nr:DUF2254 family protein [Anianabacter salinae]MBV0910999.1 DUF2254 domain-containing protein [Anianabacter salinae]